MGASACCHLTESHENTFKVLARQLVLCPAWVIHTRAYRDKDCLVDLLTRDKGRFRAVLYGARSMSKRAKTPALAGQSVSASWSGRTELKTINAFENNGCYRHYSGNALLALLYVNELLYRLLADSDPHALLFDAYGKYLQALCDKTPHTREIALRKFELILLRELGYGIDFNHEEDGKTPLHRDAFYSFEPTHGFVRVPGQTIASENNIFSGAVLVRMRESLGDDRECLSASRTMARLAIEDILGSRKLGAYRMLEFPV